MYEIWLVLNIVWEIALSLWPLLLLAALLWTVLLTVAWRRPGACWRAGLPLSLGVGAAVALIATLLLPGWTKSSLGEMAYWVDWANLLALASGFGIAAMAWTWPLAAMRRRPQ